MKILNNELYQFFFFFANGNYINYLLESSVISPGKIQWRREEIPILKLSEIWRTRSRDVPNIYFHWLVIHSIRYRYNRLSFLLSDRDIKCFYIIAWLTCLLLSLLLKFKYNLFNIDFNKHLLTSYNHNIRQ